MEDETGLELSLGLSFGGSSGKSKHKEGGLDLNPEEGNAHKRFMDRDLNVADNSLKQFLQDGIETRALIHMESQISNEPQRGDLGIHQKENFWTDLGNNSSSEVDPSYLQKESSDFSMYSKLWTHMAVPNDEEKEQSRGGLWKEASNKRKVPYEELNHQKKQSREIEHVNINGAIQSKDNAKSDAHDEVGTSSTYRIGDDVGVTINIFKPKEGSDSQTLDGLAQYGSVIKPGIAPGLKFGGCGSQPDLPWVWTSGQGPNGKPISGVTYKYGINQIRIVCACHGVHMSPDEFIQHAKSDRHNSENNTNSANPQGNGNAPSSDKK